jgi:hypothetical protein
MCYIVFQCLTYDTISVEIVIVTAIQPSPPRWGANQIKPLQTMPHSPFQTDRQATGADFDKWTIHAKELDDSTIRFIIQDCEQARTACKSMGNFERADFYLDQLCTYHDVLIERHLS